MSSAVLLLLLLNPFLLIIYLVDIVEKLNRQQFIKVLIRAGVIACIIALAALIWQTATTAPRHLWVLAGMLALSFGIELGYRRYRRHEIQL